MTKIILEPRNRHMKNICQDNMKELILDVLQSNNGQISKLKNSMGIGLGFVDGETEVIWKS